MLVTAVTLTLKYLRVLSECVTRQVTPLSHTLNTESPSLLPFHGLRVNLLIGLGPVERAIVKFFKKMYAVDENFDVDLFVSCQKIGSYRISAS